MSRRDDVERVAWLWLFALPFLLYFGWYIGGGLHKAVRGPLPRELGVGREQTLGTAGPQGELSSSSASERTAIDARISPAETMVPETERANDLPPSDSVSAGVLPRDLAPGMLPTPTGLYANTVELWSQADFLLDSGLTHLDLPTWDDCVGALQDQRTLELFTRVQALNITLGIIGQTPLERRGVEFVKSLETTARLAEAAERDLMCRMDGNGANGYPRWLEMHEKYRSWAR